MALIRVALAKIFPDLNTILSLDVDTIVNENISDIWDYDISNYYFAAAS
jgi:lipopolysaccharide biosynthesis glycosyltransferase